jgi:hypothetical protein
VGCAAVVQHERRHTILRWGLDRRGTQLMCVDQKPLSIGHADLVENVRHVMPDRTVADRQLVGDLFVRVAMPHQADNLALPLGQHVGPRRRLWIGFDRLLEGGTEGQPRWALPFHGGVGLRGDIQRLNHCEHDGGQLNLEDDAVDTDGPTSCYTRRSTCCSAANQCARAWPSSRPCFSYRA